MRLFLSLCGLVSFISGCATTASPDQLLARAAFDMHCDRQSLQVVAIDDLTRGVSGCGQRMTYVDSCDGPRQNFGTKCTWVLNTNTKSAEK